MMNKSCFCQNPDKAEIIVLKPQNFDAEIRAYFEAFCGENADEAKKTGGFSNPPEFKECIKKNKSCYPSLIE